jgi:hypothetical protein
VPRPPLGAHDPVILLGEAARRLRVTRSSMHEKVKAKSPTIRGIEPRTELNPTGRWMVSLDDVEAEERRKGLRTDPPGEELSVETMRVQMLQSALSDAQGAQVAQAETLVTELRARLADRDRQLAEKDARIAQLERQLAVMGRKYAEAAETVAELTALPGV